MLIEPAPGVDERVLRAYVLGPALSVLLYQRGFLVLHASAVALRGEDGSMGAVAFLGHSGEGKSTLAAALHARGHTLLADDFIAVPLSPQVLGAAPGPLIHAGFPQLRLWPSSLEALGQDAQALPSLYPGGQKRALGASEGFSSVGLPLHCLYVLARGEEVSISALRPASAIISMVEHGTCTGLLPPDEAAVHFGRCSDLARLIPVRRLQRPHDLKQLRQAAVAVEADYFSIETEVPGYGLHKSCLHRPRVGSST